MRTATTILATILFASCYRPPIKTAQNSDNKDSVRTDVRYQVVEKLRDTTIWLPPDSALLEALIECDSAGQAQLRKIVALQAGRKLQAPSVQLKDNRLTAGCRIDSQAVYATLKDRYERYDTSHYESHHNMMATVVEVPVNYVTGWQWFQIWCGRILLIILITWGATKLFSSKTSLLKNLTQWVKSISQKDKAA